MENNGDKYYVRRIFKNHATPRIVAEGLTKIEAQKMVAEDIETNPNAEYYMLVYTKMEPTEELTNPA